MSDVVSPRKQPTAFFALLRPKQWTKNALVAAAAFFAIWDPEQALTAREALTDTILAVVIFCVISSAVYIMNDIRDADADRQHPEKRNRPIASGAVDVTQAAWLSCVLATLGIVAAWGLLPIGFVICASSYLLLQITYTFLLKRIALVDIFIISIGFVLRAIAGGLAVRVTISSWLLVCTFLLALFIALCKRRHEKTSLTGEGADHRTALRQYNAQLLDQLISITAAATIVCYTMYTLADETCRKFGTQALGLTIPFVIFGVFRYLDLVYRHDHGGRPEKTLLTDPPIIINLFLFGLTAVAVFALT